MSEPKFTAKNIIDACGGRLLAGSHSTLAEGVSTDTRTLKEGQAFFALCGPSFNGHDFIPAALAGGSTIIVTHQEGACEWLSSQACLILVDDTLKALQRLAAWHRGRIKGKVIGITGSCGKSTVKEMTGSILSHAGKCTVAPESFNNLIGVSLTLLSALSDDDYVILELGANHRGEIDELSRIALPDAGCITCIGECHLEGFGSKEGVLEAKAELIPHISENGLLLLNEDDRMCLGLAERFSGTTRTFGFSQDADTTVFELKSGAKGELFRIGDLSFHLSLSGRHNVLNAAAAFSLARWAGASEHQALQALSKARPPRLRGEKREIGKVGFFLDCYNSNPTAVRVACETFARTETTGRRIFLFGDMLELGDKTVRLHEEAGQIIARSGVDMLITVGDNSSHVMRGWRKASSKPQNALALPEKEKAWLFLYRLTRPGDIVMVKGSRSLRMEEIVDSIGEYVAGLEQEAA